MKSVVIICAGPTSLAAALKLVRDDRAKPIVLEASVAAGGISRTVEYTRNRMDIGHRFLSKSDTTRAIRC